MTYQSELESALYRLETRLTWSVGWLVYLWIVFHFLEWWTSLVLQYPWLQEWSHSDIASIFFQFGSLGFAVLVGKLIAKLMLLKL
jgi:hypothetical protein